MTLKNPCRSCSIHLRGGDKNCPECMGCAKRVAYARAVAGWEHPVVEKIQDEILRPERRQEKENTTMSILPTKICSRKECRHGGKPQPLKDFDTHSGSKDGKAYMCKDCRREKQRDYSKKIKTQAPVATLEEPKAQASPPPAVTKICNRCKDPLPLGAFKPSADCRDGREGTCRKCRNEVRRANKLAKIKKRLHERIHEKDAATDHDGAYRFKRLAALLSGRKRYDSDQLSQIRDLCRGVAAQIDTYLSLRQIFSGGADHA